MRLARLSCNCYPATIPGRSFSLLCYQSRASGSVQSPRTLSLRPESYSYPKFGMGNRQTENLIKLSYNSSQTSTHEVCLQDIPRQSLTFPSLIICYPPHFAQLWVPNYNIIIYNTQGQSYSDQIPKCSLLFILFTPGFGLSKLFIFISHFEQGGMNQNSSFIDLLRGFNIQDEKQVNSSLPQLESQSKLLRQFPHCESMELCNLPTQNQNPSASLGRTQIKSMRCGDERSPRYQAQAPVERHSSNKDSKINLAIKSKTLGSTNTQNNYSRNNQIMFQIKLKLASFVTKFNLDSKCLANLRQQSIESLLQMMFKKFKDYTKEHEALVKNYHENIKCKEIEILNQQSKLNNLQQIYCQETNKWMKAKEKLKEENSQVQKLLQQKNIECEELQQQVYMLQSITKEQNQYIKDLENQKNNQFNEKMECLQAELSNFITKYNHLLKQSQNFNQTKLKLAQANQKLNQEINQIMEQNKAYKSESMFAKQTCDKLRTELEQNEEKLLLYYDRFMEQISNSARLNDEIKQISEINDGLVAQMRKMENVVKEFQSAKQNRIEERQLDRKQIQAWRKQCLLKQSEISKLKKTLSEVSSSKSRLLQKKTKSQIQIPSQNYALEVNPQRPKSKERQQGIQKAQQQQKIKAIIEQWRKQMEKTVDYYEKYIQKLESRQRLS